MRSKEICVNAGDMADTPKFAYARNWFVLETA